MKKILIFVFLYGIFINYSYSQQTPKEVVEVFFKVLKEKSSYEAIDGLFDNNETVKVDMKVRENVKTRVYSMVRNAGRLNGYELIKEEPLGSCVNKFTYIAKYDSKPILLEFEFYKPKDQWEVLSFKPLRSTNNLSLRGK